MSITMKSAYDIEVDIGADFVFNIRLKDDEGKPVNLVGAVIDARLAEYSESADSIPFIGMHNGTGGLITLMLTHEQTEKISFANGVYDVIVEYETGYRELVLNGAVIVNPTVTRLEPSGTLMYMVAVPNEMGLPLAGERSRLYYCTESNVVYKWNGTGYVSVMKETSVAVGTTETLPAGSEATVENVGTKKDLILNFGIPMGNGIRSIEKTATVGYTDYYRINFTDPSMEPVEFTVTNSEVPEAPENGEAYLRRDAGWVSLGNYKVDAEVSDGVLHLPETFVSLD